MSTATPEAAAPARVVAIVGPTAVGKTALAEGLALVVGAEIVSADSMQVYRGMDIGTAKPPLATRRASYHCIDLVAPGVPFSAALYQQAARAAIADIWHRGALPIVCGGSGLYVRAALDDWRFPEGEPESALRADLEAEAARLGPQALHDRLRSLDAASAAIIHPSNVRRTIRALEMHAEGASYAKQAQRFSTRTSVYDVTFIGLTMEREKLYERIDERVDGMIADGLLGEVERLLSAGFRDALTATQAIGYKELVPVIESGADAVEAVAAIKQATRRYAKRQLTWFRADRRICWLDVTDMPVSAAIVSARGLLESDARPTGVPAPTTWRLHETEG